MPVKYLETTSCFKHLASAELKRLFSIAKTVRVPANTMIFSKDEAGETFFVVNSGRVKIFTTTATDRTKTLAYLGPGDFFGEMALLGGKVRSASARAEEDSELLVITKANFNRLIKKDGEFTLQLLHTLSERLRKADEEIEALLFHNMLGRLAGAILKLCGEVPPGCEPPGIEMSIQELADYIGTTREPLSRALAMLRRTGMLDYKDRKISITDIARLKAIAPQHQ